MRDRAPSDDRGVAPARSRIGRFAQRLEQTKVTVTTVAIFFLILALMCGLAAGVGYFVHHLERH